MLARRLLPMLFAALALLLPRAAFADERILSFVSDIAVQPDASLAVTERIQVRSEGTSIRHGIYRDFPTRYRTGFGREVRVDFAVQEVLRDGSPEPWTTSPVGNGVRIRIGDADRVIEPGEHLYLIRYTTTRQLGFFKDYDELYWNVTGNGWMFPIDLAEARIRLPKAVPLGDRAFYTGPQGSTAQEARVLTERPGDITIRTTAPLGPYEGFTVSAAWPKGVVAEPDSRTLAGWWFADNGPPLVGLLGLLGVLGYYFHAWRRAGRGPRAGTIVPIFAPPEGITPAAMRYIDEMGSDNRTFAAALIDLGVRGKVRLVEGEKGFLSRAKTTIEKTAEGHDLPPPEAEMMRALFLLGDTIEMDNANHGRFSAAQSGLSGALKKQYEGTMFVRNWMWSVRGIFIVVLAVLCTAVALILAAPFYSAGAFYTAIWTLAAAAGSIMLFLWPLEGAARWIARGVAVVLALIVLAMGVALFGMAVESGRVLPMLLPLVSLPVAISAFSWMAAPTRAGRGLLDRIEGFRQYLSITEEERLQAMHPPEKTPALFEKYLPYAIALKVENAWADRFSGVLAAAAAAGHAQGFAWYSGHSDPWSHPGNFVGQVGASLSSTISSSSSAPGSSSGSGGGGSSGGGGGGGGGGGW